LGNDDTAADTTLPVLARKGLKVVVKRGQDTPYSRNRNSLMKASKLVANTVAVSAVRSKASAKIKESVTIARKKKQDAREEANNKECNAINDTKSEDPGIVKLQEELENTQKSLDDSILKFKVRSIEIAISSAFIVSKYFLYLI
jgi:aspartate oxidase